MTILAGRRNAPFVYQGRHCIYTGQTPTGRHMFTSGDGWMLEVPDPDTGLPVWPNLEQVQELMARMLLVPRSDPLDNPVRQIARQEEPTRKELVEAKQKSNPNKRRDPRYGLRELVLKTWE